MRNVALLVFLAIGCHSESKPVSSAFTLHYHRPLADYSGWSVLASAGAVESSVTASKTDGFGAVYTLTLKPGAKQLVLNPANGSATNSSGYTVDVSGTTREGWLFSGFDRVITHAPAAVPTASQVALYYVRPDKTYDGWGLHLWGDQVTGTSWGSPLTPVGIDPDLGAGFLIDLKPGSAPGNCPPGHICFIVHKADTKDPGPDITAWQTSVQGNIVFVVSGSSAINSAPIPPGGVTIDGAGAHLLARDTLAWKVTDPAAVSFELRYSPSGGIVASGTDVTGGSTIAVTPRAAALASGSAPPQFTGWRAFDIAASDLPKLKDALKRSAEIH